MNDMPQSLARILIHYVFSTKNREPWITDVIREELHGYIGGIIREMKGALLKAGSVEDHIHLLIVHPRTASPAQLMEEIKTSTTKWLKKNRKELSIFRWQNGYGAFSVSSTHRISVERYIARQLEHHKGITFMEEYRELLKNNDIQFDERYAWE